jgi:uncharacterized protein YtpQ (UPF0354 family)
MTPRSAPDGKESTAFLNNLWLKYKNGNEDRAGLIEKYIRFAQDVGKREQPPDRGSIVAMIKDTQYVEVIRGSSKKVTEHLCADLWIVYAVDKQETITTLTREQVFNAGVVEDELKGLAIANLRRILPEVQRHGDGPWYLLTAGGDYVRSLLLFDEIWDQLADTVKGQIVATVPTRDVLMFTGSESAEGVQAIRERSADICSRSRGLGSRGSHAISDTLIIRNNGAWRVFKAN